MDDCRDVPERIREAARVMLDELESGWLEVCKIPGRDGEGFVRCVITQNAEWYRRFCAEWTRRRRRYPKERTIIKRCETVRALREMIGGRIGSEYARRLIPHAERMADELELAEPNAENAALRFQRKRPTTRPSATTGPATTSELVAVHGRNG